jgi:pimeloyl-ACP methyl ester carboxylesterase
MERVKELTINTELLPISMYDGMARGTILTGHDILFAFRVAVYKPLALFHSTAETLNDALNGNYTGLVNQIGLPPLKDACPFPTPPEQPVEEGDATRGIACGDGEDATNFDIPFWQSYVDKLMAQSRTFGPFWNFIRFGCAGWTIRPKWRFTGPFTTPEHDAGLVKGKPAAPLLFLSTKLDPVTPKSNAFAMAAKHPGARVMVQDSVGHCTLSSPSDCTAQVIRNYLLDGTMPEHGKVCKADCHPWQPCAQTFGVSSLTMDTSELRRGKRPLEVM